MTRRTGTKKKGRKASPEDVLDSYESWLERQRPKPVTAKHGFIADATIKESE